jgi:hypothetical protein
LITLFSRLDDSYGSIPDGSGTNLAHTLEIKEKQSLKRELERIFQQKKHSKAANQTVEAI